MRIDRGNVGFDASTKLTSENIVSFPSGDVGGNGVDVGIG